ncbi:MAG TPA: hypothetical protein VN841_01955 [Bryobacteraceae bacterium]|nr:hypothetical protein [Bryobacteraceae bacterium]
MGKSAERGTVLLAVWVRSVLSTALIWALLALTVAMVAAQYWKTGDFYAGALPSALAVLTYALHPRIRFFDGGVEIPAVSGQKAHFLTWQQVDRYRWDGDALVLIGTNSVLSGGPAEGGTARIPASQRGTMAQILAAKVRSS